MLERITQFLNQEKAEAPLASRLPRQVRTTAGTLTRMAVQTALPPTPGLGHIGVQGAVAR